MYNKYCNVDNNLNKKNRAFLGTILFYIKHGKYRIQNIIAIYSKNNPTKILSFVITSTGSPSESPSILRLYFILINKTRGTVQIRLFENFSITVLSVHHKE